MKVGGKLTYSTCSLEVEEDEDVVEAFAAYNRGFKLEKPGLSKEFITERGYGRTFPHRDTMDGFFVSCFRRIS